MSVWHIALAQMKRSKGRLIPAGIAIAIATAFVAATVLVTTIVDQTARASVSERYAKADLVVQTDRWGERMLQAADYARIASADDVTAASADSVWSAVVSDPSDTRLAPVSAKVQAWDPDFPTQDALTFTSGSLPTGPGQVAIDSGTAHRLSDPTASVPDEVLRADGRLTIAADGAAPYTATISGVFTIKGDSSPLIIAAPADLAHPAKDDGGLVYSRMYLTSSDPAATKASIQAEFSDMQVTEVAEQIEADFAAVMVSINLLIAFVYGFVAVALFVSGLVIANTFQVLIAARTRTLALQRCLGATRSQVRRAVIYEALVLGVVGSVIGLALGALITQAALLALAPAADLLLPRLITPSWQLLAAPLALGILVTLLAALLPARLATRVAPLEALRPQEAPQLGHRTSKVRLAAGLALILAGGAITAIAVWVALGQASGETILALLAAAVLGSILLVTGALLTTVFWLPRLVRWLGFAIGRRGGDTRLATVNAIRNPRRTAATAAALIIAVGLVSLMATGASVARAGLTNVLTEQYPIDLAVTAIDTGADETETGAADTGAADAVPADAVPSDAEAGASETDTNTDAKAADAAPVPGDPQVPQAIGDTDESLRVTGRNVISSSLVDQISHLPGVEAAAPLRGARATTKIEGHEASVSVALVDPTALGAVAPADIADPVSKGAALTGQRQGAIPPGSLQLRDTDGTAHTLPTDGALRRLALPVPSVIAPTGTLGDTADDAPVVALWLRLAPGANVSELRDQIDAMTASASSGAVVFDVSGGFEQRQRYESVIGTVLLVVLGLLAIAVVIALIGVTNTLALSIRERRRETALLRALGVTARRVRRQLAIEGMLIAGIGALAGIVLGAVLGWAGATTLLAAVSGPTFDLPWGWLGVLLLAAVGAGALASLTPGRAATKIPVTQGLATE